MVFWRTMVPLVSFLAALRILTEAQSCNNGVGKLVYEKVSDYKLGGSATFNAARQRNEVVTRMDVPIKVLQECVRRCQEDRTTAIQQCLSFDFVPGRRRPFNTPAANALTAPGSNIPSSGSAVQYEESSCYFYFDRASPDGGDTLIRQNNAWHYNEVCLTSTKVSTDCPSRLYVFDRTPGYKFEGDNDKEVFASNRTECEDKCLNEYEFTCRSATFDRAGQRCRLSRMTKSMKPEALRTDPNSDYMENMCLSSSQLCTTTAFILESGKELDGAFERETVSVRDFQECSTLCTHSLDDKGFLCRSFLYDDKSRTCLLYDEDPLGITEGPDSQRPLKSSTGDLYRVICGTSDRDAPINNATFECYRRKRLDWSHQVEVKSYSFQECLDECMKRYARDCHSVEYSSRYQSCRFSSNDGYGSARPNLIDDDSYDYYEFKWYRGGGNYPGGYTGSWPNQGGSAGGSGIVGSGSGVPPGPHYGSGSGLNPNYSGWRGGGGGSGYGGYGGGGMGGMPPIPGAGFGLNPPSSGGYGGGYGGTYGGYGSYGSGFGGGNGGGSYGAPYGGGYPGPNLPPYPPKEPLPFPPGFPMDKCKPGPGGVGGTFRKVGYGVRLRPFYVRRVVRTERLEECERACAEAVDLVCRSFNFRTFVSDNCELSDYDTRQLQITNPSHFEQNTQFDYYEKDGNGISSRVGPDCLDVSQTCSPDGMEFTLKTPEGFFGRVYTYGFYDSCFFDGNGGTTNVLRISRANGFPRCGTQQYGDVITNIVVVQFNDFVQTSRDKKYNLTCYFSGPGEAVVTSNYLDTRTDGRYPTQIEHLPAQNILTSNVVLRVLYRGTPTNTIAVGDLLTFRLEARGHYRFEFFSDIFATNVIAKDPYSGRQVHLIDSRGCPVDLYVFPELHRTPDGALEAEFYAFKIPDSNLLVFQATVRSCRGPCEPVICNDRGRPGTFPSWGKRRRRAVNTTRTSSSGSGKRNATRKNPGSKMQNATDDEEEEEVHELLQVYFSRSDMPAVSPSAIYKTPTVCVAQAGYYALVVIVAVLVCLMIALGFATFLYIRRIKRQVKTSEASSTSPSTTNLYVSQFQPPRFEDPSEPIYTDPSLFERSRSMRSLTVCNMGKVKSIDYE